MKEEDWRTNKDDSNLFGQKINNLPTHYHFLLFHRKQTLRMKICQKT